MIVVFLIFGVSFCFLILSLLKGIFKPSYLIFLWWLFLVTRTLWTRPQLFVAGVMTFVVDCKRRCLLLRRLALWVYNSMAGSLAMGRTVEACTKVNGLPSWQWVKTRVSPQRRRLDGEAVVEKLSTFAEAQTWNKNNHPQTFREVLL